MNLSSLVKFAFWLAASAAMFTYAFGEYANGTMVNWYYYRAAENGYAINDQSFLKATPDKPVYLPVAASEEINGPMAVTVKKGDLLPRGANGVIAEQLVKDGKRAAVEGDKLKVMIPSQIKEDKGIKYVDTFKHKGIETNPWSGVWNVVVILLTGLSLGMLAQAFTDLIGLKYKKIQHSGAGH